MGILIYSKELGTLIALDSEARIPTLAYKLELGEDNKITWHAVIDGQEVVENKEPQTSGWQRFKAWFLRIAPEKQL